MAGEVGRPLAVVTGASSGIGLELAKQLAARGFDLLVTAEDVGVSVVADGVAEAGVAVRSVRADLTTADGAAHLVAEIRATGRPVDVLALNAGVGRGGAFVETPLEDDLEVVHLNVVAAVRLAKALLPPMVSRGSGRGVVSPPPGGPLTRPLPRHPAAAEAVV